MQKNRIDFAMDALSLSAATLSRAAGVDASIINKWRKGSRSMTKRSAALTDVAAALVRLDRDALLFEYYAPYLEGDHAGEAMAAWLMDDAPPGLWGRVTPPKAPTSGEHTVEHMVYLGRAGFRKAALAMLDYVRLLPPGQTITVLCHGKWEWFVGDLPFVLLFISKLRQAVTRGTRLRMINRKGFSLADAPPFAGIWLTAHLKGYVRSLYYAEKPPRAIRFVASIPGSWSARAEEDDSVADSLYLTMHTHPRETRRDADFCQEYALKSRPASQYAFLSDPLGSRENRRLWRMGPLPTWNIKGAPLPDGSFFALCRVPGIGLTTWEEVYEIAGEDRLPPMPEYLLLGEGSFAPGPHKIILCREDVMEGFLKERRMNEVMSAILHRRAFAPRRILSSQVARLVEAMETREDFEVALMPRSAFAKLNLEMVSFRDSVTIAWLQDMSESVFNRDEATAKTFYSFLDYTWNKLQKGWKRKKTVSATLRKWMTGQELDQDWEPGAQEGSWDLLSED